MRVRRVSWPLVCAVLGFGCADNDRDSSEEGIYPGADAGYWLPPVDAGYAVTPAPVTSGWPSAVSDAGWRDAGRPLYPSADAGSAVQAGRDAGSIGQVGRDAGVGFPTPFPGATPGSPSVPPNACASLAPCCSLLTDEEDVEDCEGTVQEADAEACEEAVGDFCASTMPPMPTRPQCVALLECCGALEDEEDVEDCEGVVAEDDAAACEEEAMELCMTDMPPEEDD